MFKIGRFAAFFCGIVAGVANANAMDLSLATAVDKIVAESQDLKKADANIKKAQASLDAVNANRWFSVDGTVGYTNLINVKKPFDSYGVDLTPEMGGLLARVLGTDIDHLEIPDNIFTAGVTITQPIYTFGKIGNAVDGVRSAIKMADASREMTLRAVKYSAADIYWTAKMTDEIVKISKQDLDSARNAKKSLTSAGRANRSNLVKIESDIAAKEINLSDAEFNRDTAHRMLKILAGIDMNEELNLTDNFPSDFSDLGAGELKSTPQWRALNEQVMMYEKQARS